MLRAASIERERRGCLYSAGGALLAVRGCSIEGGRRLLLGELPLLRAARDREGREKRLLIIWGCSARCAGLLD